MEGLIPMMYKAIKRNKVRRKYRCLSVSAAQTYNLADFYDDNHDHHNNDHDHDQIDKFYTPPAETQTRGGGLNGRSNGHGQHRRYASTGDFEINSGYDNFNYDHEEDVHGYGGNKSSSPPKHIMKRYKSRRMFSCITGGI